ncbi:MAG: ABC transporter ATP-binding protein [Candidatus Hermodarchaeota archaeon]
MALGVIAARDLHVYLDETHALKGINLEVQKGEILSIVGPNGAGKTTLLRALGGLITPSSGEVTFHDDTVTDENRESLRQNATVVFQKPVHFGTSVSKNIAYGLRIRGMDETIIAKRVQETLVFVGLEGFGTRMARSLSGGEQRRVALARALVLDPEILLLDEPTADLDIDSARAVEEVLRKANAERGTTIIISTHNMFQAETLAHRTAIIQDGTIGRIGKPNVMLGAELEKLQDEGRALNTFKGKATWLSEERAWRGLLRIQLTDSVSVQAVGTHDGAVTIWISPQDVIVSKESILSSARNTLTGNVVGIDDSDSTILLTVDVGVEIAVQITQRSLKDLKLGIGDMVHVTFKASSVVVF